MNKKVINSKKEQIKKLEQEGSPLAMLAYISLKNEENGFYTLAELTRIGMKNNVEFSNPFAKIRVGTKFGKNVKIGENVIISGKNVVIGDNTSLANVEMTGNNISLGRDNILNGFLAKLDNITIGDRNEFRGTKIMNEDKVTTNANLKIGNDNEFGSYSIFNSTGEELIIGHHNIFGDGSVMRSMVKGWIVVGNYNKIGLDGKGVLSTSYDYGNKYCGPVVVGCGMDTKRGAELLGLSAFGFTLEQIRLVLKGNTDAEIKQELAIIFKGSLPSETTAFLEKLKNQIVLPLIDDPLIFKPKHSLILIVGATKPKYSIILGDEQKETEIRDNTRIQHSVILPGTNIGESYKLYFTVVESDTVIDSTTRTLVGEKLTDKVTPTKDGYPAEDWSGYFRP